MSGQNAPLLTQSRTASPHLCHVSGSRVTISPTAWPLNSGPTRGPRVSSGLSPFSLSSNTRSRRHLRPHLALRVFTSEEREVRRPAQGPQASVDPVPASDARPSSLSWETKPHTPFAGVRPFGVSAESHLARGFFRSHTRWRQEERPLSLHRLLLSCERVFRRLGNHDTNVCFSGAGGGQQTQAVGPADALGVVFHGITDPAASHKTVETPSSVGIT